MKSPLLLLLLIALTTTSFSQIKKRIVGYWYKPKTMINVRFYPNNTFEYSDYDSTSNKSEKLSGKYKLKGSVLTLEFSDKTKQTLSFEKDKTGKKNYFLKQENSYFIKDERVNNAVPVDSTKSTS